jgi:glycosyltransferase involved in cell wall biosynthesis
MMPGTHGRRLRERHHPELDGQQVLSFTASLLRFEAMSRLQRLPGGWPHILRRNEWFQDCAIEAIGRHHLLPAAPTTGEPTAVLAYSYAARRVLALARRRGATTVLAQIDPGPLEQQVVREELARNPQWRAHHEDIPAIYFDRWREECDAADWIVVNSEWSREALVQAGIPAARIVVIPLIYQPPAMPTPPAPRKAPARGFNASRPLRVLFLGSLIVRKGIHHALEAARRLRQQPVEFYFVGIPGVDLPADLAEHPRLHWVGAVPRSRTHDYYRLADLFLFPTVSDGFGLTQLEARSWGLPLIVSRRCGDVVRDGETGVLLRENSPEMIVEAIEGFLAEPERLEAMSHAALAPDPRFTPDAVIRQFAALTSPAQATSPTP